MAKILVIEDEENLRFTIRRALAKAGYSVTDVASLADARAALQVSDFELILSDVMLGGHDNGLEFVKELRSEAVGYDGTVVVMTAFSSVENAISAMRDGADDYIQKPLSLEELGMQVGKWIEHRRLAQRVKLYERLEKSREQEEEAIGESPAWRQCLALADRLASIPLPAATAAQVTPTDTADRRATLPSPAPVGGSASLPCILITGETGVGKGVLARHIHTRAVTMARSSGGKNGPDAPFVHVNCSALPATLVEGELFGHEKGAFTDAREARPGLFEMADGGTIFLDEVSETPLEFQAKLLTVLEHGTFRRVGGSRERRVRVRVIAASNQNLEQRVQQGAFRRDLLYRLNAFQVKIPPLRDRGDDVLLIAEAMIDRLSRRYGRGGRHLSAAAQSAVRSHPWHGNVRELVNAVQRAVMLCDDAVIGPEDLGIVEGVHEAAFTGYVPTLPLTSLRSGSNGSHGSNGLNGSGRAGINGSAGSAGLSFDFEHGLHKAADVEKELIMQALRYTRGNVSRAAKLIAMQRSSLRYRIDRYGLEQYVVEVANR